MQILQTKPTKPKLPNQTCQTKPDQTYQTKPTKTNLPKQTYQNTPTKPNLPNQTKPNQTKYTEPNLPNQNYWSKQSTSGSVVPLAMFKLEVLDLHIAEHGNKMMQKYSPLSGRKECCN